VITVLLRYDHHVDHTFLEATHYRDDDSVLTVYVGEQEVARFPAGSWDGVYRHESTRVREKDGRERTAQRLLIGAGVTARRSSCGSPGLVQVTLSWPTPCRLRS